MPRVGDWLDYAREVAISAILQDLTTDWMGNPEQRGVTLCLLPPLEDGQADSLQTL